MVPLVRACHLQPTLAVTAVVTVLALASGRGAGAVWVALAVLTGQLSVGWSNDYLDRERDRSAGRADKPVATGEVPARTVGAAAVLALTACVPLSLLSGWRAGGVHLAAVAVAWAYNAWLKRTPASPLPYALAFGAVPAFVTLGLPGHPWPPAWATTAGALLGAGAHFVNTLPDLADDVRTGVRGLPHRLGAGPSLLLGALLLAGAALAIAVLPDDGLGAPGAAATAVALCSVTGVVGAAATGHTRAAWTLVLVTAGATVALFLARGAALA